MPPKVKASTVKVAVAVLPKVSASCFGEQHLVDRGREAGGEESAPTRRCSDTRGEVGRRLGSGLGRPRRRGRETAHPARLDGDDERGQATISQHSAGWSASVGVCQRSSSTQASQVPNPAASTARGAAAQRRRSTRARHRQLKGTADEVDRMVLAWYSVATAVTAASTTITARDHHRVPTATTGMAAASASRSASRACRCAGTASPDRLDGVRHAVGQRGGRSARRRTWRRPVIGMKW